MLTSRKASEIIGIHANTLRKWANEGKIKHIRTAAGQRLYDVDSFLVATKTRKRIVYCRVSSRNQKDDLQSQIKCMRERYPQHEIIEDFGSGLNFKRKGFNSLLEQVLQGNVEEIAVAHRDRLCRFGFELIQSIANKNSCKIVVLDESKLSPQAELVQDLLSIIHVFSCRLYGLRKYSNKIKEDKDLS
ncbi:MAG: IS607 family transposase [Parachlamydia sp.]|nr:IS607 family transposase [Parachlamydia sp.]